MFEKMREQLMKKMGSGSESKLSDSEKEAKLSVLKDLSSQAGEKMADKIKSGLMVKVAASSPGAMKSGLKKAEDLVSSVEGCEDGTCGLAECATCGEEGEHESEDKVDPMTDDAKKKYEEKSPSLEDLQSKINELTELLSKKQ